MVKLPPEKETSFKRSKQLRVFFNEHFEQWKRKNRLGLEDLALRCGVTSSYLSHVGRYGRVPAKPVLILLALNFELEDPEVLFQVAEVSESWPYDSAIKLSDSTNSTPGFMSLKLDMKGFAQAIREIVKAETRPRSVKDLSMGFPLKVGFNLHQDIFFSETEAPPAKFDGVFSRIYNLLAISLQSDSTPKGIDYTKAFEYLRSGELDIYGPIYSTPKRLGMALYTIPFCTVGISALGRKHAASSLVNLPLPKNIQELKSRPYELAVLKESSSHHFAATVLGRSDESLILCDTGDEVFERIVLGGIKRPAHLSICDSPIAIKLYKSQKRDCELLFGTKETLLGMDENTIAVRPDWPELVAILNEAIKFAIKSGSLQEILISGIEKEYREVVGLPVLN